VMLEQLFVQGLERLGLRTDPATRARGCYSAEGWQGLRLLPREGWCLNGFRRARVDRIPDRAAVRPQVPRVVGSGS